MLSRPIMIGKNIFSKCRVNNITFKGNNNNIRNSFINNYTRKYIAPTSTIGVGYRRNLLSEPLNNSSTKIQTKHFTSTIEEEEDAEALDRANEFWADSDKREEAVRISDDLFAVPNPNAPQVDEILKQYELECANRTKFHAGYPYNLDYDFVDLFPFLKYSINNLGDPFVKSNYGVHSRVFEQAVIDFFARMWKLDDDYWGYVTSCGTEGNLHSILLARENHPDGILMSSTQTHYSIFKAAKAYRMEVEAIDCLQNGEINYEILETKIEQYASAGRDIILNLNLGTTVRGAVDDVDRVLDMFRRHNVKRENFHIHCDGALFGIMMPVLPSRSPISFQKPIDSIAVSGHKFLGCPMPCGITLTRKKHLEKMSEPVEYLNSIDTTIMGSRNGHAALFMWYALKTKGIKGLEKDVLLCFDNAKYLYQKLIQAGIHAERNDLSTTVVLERPNEEFVQRWQLACEGDIAHVVVMPNITTTVIDRFVDELINGF